MRMSGLHAHSGGIFLEANPLYDLVRPGYALYGAIRCQGSESDEAVCGLKHKSFRCVFSNR